MTLVAKATRQHTKDHNSRLVVRVLYEHEPISRAELARMTGLTRTTVSAVVAELLEQGLVIEVGQGLIPIGRVPTMLRINPSAHQIAALSITNSTLRGALVDLRGGFSASFARPLPAERGPVVVEELLDAIGTLTAQASAPLLGIGISTPGLVDVANGLVLEAVHVGWRNVPLRALVQERYPLPVHVAHDGHAAALAEYLFGIHSAPTLIALRVGWGVGAGILLQGALINGDISSAGEIGHVPVAGNHRPCNCGNVGCLETLLSSRYVLECAAEIARTHPDSRLAPFADTPDLLTYALVAEAVQQLDLTLGPLVDELGQHLSMAIAALVSVLPIRRVVVSGPLAAFGEPLRAATLRQLPRRVLPGIAAATDLRLSDQGAQELLQGMGALVLMEELGLGRVPQSS